MIPKKNIYINKNLESNNEYIEEDIKNTDERKFYDDDINKNLKRKKSFNKKEEKGKKSQMNVKSFFFLI